MFKQEWKKKLKKGKHDEHEMWCMLYRFTQEKNSIHSVIHSFLSASKATPINIIEKRDSLPCISVCTYNPPLCFLYLEKKVYIEMKKEMKKKVEQERRENSCCNKQQNERRRKRNSLMETINLLFYILNDRSKSECT